MFEISKSKRVQESKTSKNAAGSSKKRKTDTKPEMNMMDKGSRLQKKNRKKAPKMGNENTFQDKISLPQPPSWFCHWIKEAFRPKIWVWFFWEFCQKDDDRWLCCDSRINLWESKWKYVVSLYYDDDYYYESLTFHFPHMKKCGILKKGKGPF